MQLTPDQLKKQVESLHQAVEAKNSQPAAKPIRPQNIRPNIPANIKIQNNPSGAKPAIFRRNSPNQ